MKFMVMVKANAETEAGMPPSEELLTAMMKYNEELANAGVLVEGAGLLPSSKGVRVRFEGDRRTVIDGPFAETKELLAGYWIMQADSMDEIIEWVKRVPGMEGDLEIRRIAEAEDFGDSYTADVREAEERVREKLASGK